MNDSFMTSDAMNGSFTASRPARSSGAGAPAKSRWHGRSSAAAPARRE